MTERTSERLRGVWAAVVTPIDAFLQPDANKAVAYYRHLLAAGCDGVNIFGTTGEAMSFGTAQRCEFMEAIARSGLPMKRVMAGTGATSLEETASLTSHAIDLEFAAVLLMPPFFYRDPGDDGIVRFFDALFARVPVPPGKAILYNFPSMSGITFHPALVDRLIKAFPAAIAGLKDSSNDRDLQAELHKRHPSLAILPGSEHYLDEAAAAGASGCISGSVALWPELAQRVHRIAGKDDARKLAAFRMTLRGLPFIPAVRYRIARSMAGDSWRTPMPPLVSLTAAECAELDRRFDALRDLN